MNQSLLERIAKSAKLRVAGAVLAGFLGYQVATSYNPSFQPKEAYAMEAEGAVTEESEEAKREKWSKFGEYREEGWEVPDLSNAEKYSDRMYDLDDEMPGKETRGEKYWTDNGGRIFKFGVNGRTLSLCFDHDMKKPVDYEIIDIDGDGDFELRTDGFTTYDTPQWIHEL